MVSGRQEWVGSRSHLTERHVANDRRGKEKREAAYIPLGQKVFVDVQGIDGVHVKGTTVILLTSDWTQQRQPRLGAANPLSLSYTLITLLL